jgi:integrase
MTRALTDAFIRRVPLPKSGRLEVADPACRGLRFRVTPSGEKSFAFRYGRTERITLGKYPDVSLRDARERADELRRQVAAGKNPAAHKRGASERTFAALAERYLNEHARRFKRSADADERNLRVHVLPQWADRDFTTIERADLIKLVERLVTADKPIAANRVQALVSSIYSFAADADLVKVNPFLRLRKRGQERAKTRTLADDEIRLFWERVVLPPVSRATGLALRLVLAAGCRPGEAAGMTKGELELDGEGRPTGWMITAERSKNRRAHLLPLSPIAVELVSEALALAGDSEMVFPSRVGGNGSIESHALAVAMRRLADALPDGQPGADNWRADPPTPHDLRRTCATRLASAGVPGEDVAAILNHVRGDVTGRHYDQYARAKEKSIALGRWSQLLTAILTPQAPNVVALGRR